MFKIENKNKNIVKTSFFIFLIISSVIFLFLGFLSTIIISYEDSEEENIYYDEVILDNNDEEIKENDDSKPKNEKENSLTEEEEEEKVIFNSYESLIINKLGEKNNQNLDKISVYGEANNTVSIKTNINYVNNDTDFLNEVNYDLKNIIEVIKKDIEINDQNTHNAYTFRIYTKMYSPIDTTRQNAYPLFVILNIDTDYIKSMNENNLNSNIFYDLTSKYFTVDFEENFYYSRFVHPSNVE